MTLINQIYFIESMASRPYSHTILAFNEDDWRLMMWEDKTDLVIYIGLMK